MSYHNNPRIVTDGLVLCLDANAKRSYSGSGSTWYDLTSNGNNGTITGATYNTTYFTFNGSSNYIDLGNPSTLTNLNGANLTIMAAIYMDTLPTTSCIFTARGGSTNEMYFGVTSAGALNFDRYLPGGGGASSSSLTMSTGSWAIVGASATHQSSVLFFKNGTSENISHTETYSGGTPTKVTIAAQDNGTSFQRYLDGNIAFVLVYDRALSSSEMIQNYNAHKSRFGL